MAKRTLFVLCTMLLVVIICFGSSYALSVYNESKLAGKYGMVANFELSNNNEKELTIASGKTKTFDIILTNPYIDSVNYAVAYSLKGKSELPSGVIVAESSLSKNHVNASINANETKTISLIIVNNSDEEVTLLFSIVMGYKNGGQLIVPSDKKLVSEIYTLPINRDKIYITEITYDSDVNADLDKTEIINFAKANIKNKIVLSSSDAKSSITYNVTLYNSDTSSYYFESAQFENTDNENIIVSTSEIAGGEEIKPKSYKTLKLTFSYKDNKIPTKNELNSIVRINFMKSVMQAYESGKELWKVKANVTKIIFQNKMEPIKNADDKWDLSLDSDGSVMGYLVGTEVYIQGNGGIALSSGTDLFRDFTSLQTIENMDILDTSEVTNIDNMFRNCTNLTSIGDISGWNTSNVTSMHSVFEQASSLENIGTLANWDVRKVTNTSGMFYRASSLQSLDLSKWKTDSLKLTYEMFRETTKLTSIGDISGWDMSHVSDAYYMFTDAKALTDLGDLGKWNTESFEKLNALFRGCTHLVNIGDISTWKMGKVTTMEDMFRDCSRLPTIGDISTWDTKSVTTLEDTFRGCTVLDNIGELNDWNTSNVTTLHGMFTDAAAITNIGTLENWDVKKVTDVSMMFMGASSLQSLDLSKWQFDSLTTAYEMFQSATSLTTLGDISGWNLTNVRNLEYMFYKNHNLTYIGSLSTWDVQHVYRTDSMFYECHVLSGLDLSDWNTKDLEQAEFMFYDYDGADSIGNLSGWNTKLVNNMSNMFAFSSLKDLGDISNWDTYNVTDMSETFRNTHFDKLDISGWNTTHVTTFEKMFKEASLPNITMSLKNETTPVITEMFQSATGSVTINYRSSLKSVVEELNNQNDAVHWGSEL